MSRNRAFFTVLFAVTVSACGDEETSITPPAAASYGGSLAVDIRGSVEVSLHGTSPRDTTVALTVTGAAAPHLIDDGTKLEGPGRFEPLPEAGSELYVAKLALPADPAGPCADQPRAVALALHHRSGTSRFAGALTIYCGNAHHGVPARVLRLSGTLEHRSD